jgi:C4-type Zn-finger protein
MILHVDSFRNNTWKKTRRAVMPLEKVNNAIQCPRCQSPLKKLPETTTFDNLLEYICEKCGYRYYVTKGLKAGDLKSGLKI